MFPFSRESFDSLPPKVACIAVLRSLDESLSAHPEDEFPNVSPSLWNAKLWKEGLQIPSVSVKSIRMYQWIIECSSSFLRNERFSFGMLIDQLCGNRVTFHHTLQIVCLSNTKPTPFLDYWLSFTFFHKPFLLIFLSRLESPHCSVLSHILFLILIHDLTDSLGSPHCHFADDSMLCHNIPHSDKTAASSLSSDLDKNHKLVKHLFLCPNLPQGRKPQTHLLSQQPSWRSSVT